MTTSSYICNATLLDHLYTIKKRAHKQLTYTLLVYKCQVRFPLLFKFKK